MKKKITVVLLLIGLVVNAQGKYSAAMDKAFGEWKQGNTKEAVAMFERIANTEKDNWIPFYYQVFIQVTEGFNIKDAEEKEKGVKQNAMLIETQVAKKENAEWLVLVALNMTLDITTDPMNKGMTLSSKVNALYDKALLLEPNNPRALFQKANFNLQSAKYTGIDTAAYCELVNRAVKNFDSLTSEEPFYPSWGKEQAIKVKEACGK